MSDTKAAKEFKKAPVSIFTNAADLLGITHAELCVDLGYSGNPFRSWIASGDMPFVASIACQHLLAQSEIRSCLLLISVAPNKRQAVESVLKAMSVDFTQIAVS